MNIMKRTTADQLHRPWLRLFIIAVAAAQTLFILAQIGSMALARHLWLADLANFIRLHLMIVGISLAFLGLLLRARLTRIGAVVAFAVAVAPYLLLLPPAPYLGGVEIRIVSANVLVENQHPEDFVALADVREADVLVLQEMRPVWQDRLIETGIWAHESSRDLRSRTDMKVFSRFPVLNETVISAESDDTGGRHPLRLELDVEGRTLIVYAIHAQTPRSSRMWRERTAYFRDLAQAVGAERPDAAVILVGDWNTPPFSPLYKDLLTQVGYARADAGLVPHATRFSLRLAALPQIGVPIDHIVLSPNVGAVSLRTSEKFGSNHLAIVARISLP